MGNRSSAAKAQRVKRTNLGFLGVDLVTLTTHDQITTAINSGDLNRLQVISPDDISKLPWYARNFFRKSRFYNPKFKGGYFLPIRDDNTDDYRKGKAYMDKRLATSPDTSEHSSKVARAIADPNTNLDDPAMAGMCAQAIWRYIVPEGHPPIPDSIIRDASKQIGSLGDSFNPFKQMTENGGTERVYSYALETVAAVEGAQKPPPQCSPDPAHPIFAMLLFARMILRGIVDNPSADIATIFCSVGPTESVARMTTRDSTLGGLLSDKRPARAGKTIILLEIRSAARETNNLSYVFAGGPSDNSRSCCARFALLKFFDEVKTEYNRIKTSQQNEGQDVV